MKISIQLNDLNYLYDYLSMNIGLFIVGGKYSSQAILNLNIEEIKQVKDKCKDRLVYVLVNGLYDQHEIEDLTKYLFSLNNIVDGILFQDFGVLQIVKENNLNLTLMYSPDTLNTNSKTIKVLSTLGIDSAFISRVIPLEEQLLIKKDCNIPVMIQGHGVEYIASSKRNLLSTYKEATNIEYHSKVLKMRPRGNDFKCNIYEDTRGTHIVSESRLYTLDLFNTIQVFDYLYIETLMMNSSEAIEVCSIYSDALLALNKGTYNKEVKEFLPLLRKINPNLSRGFLFDQSVYKLEDIREIDNERNQ